MDEDRVSAVSELEIGRNLEHLRDEGRLSETASGTALGHNVHNDSLEPSNE